jgi:hypothetical protein
VTGIEKQTRGGAGQLSAELLTYHLMLPSIIFGGFRSRMAMHNDSHDDPGRSAGQGGGETERDDGQPESSGPSLTGVA